MVVAEHDHARDGGIVLGKRLENAGLNCKTVIVKKAFHGFWTSSKLLGSFEEKDDDDVDKILCQISSALNTEMHEDMEKLRESRKLNSRKIRSNTSSCSVASMTMQTENNN